MFYITDLVSLPRACLACYCGETFKTSFAIQAHRNETGHLAYHKCSDQCTHEGAKKDSPQKSELASVPDVPEATSSPNKSDQSSIPSPSQQNQKIDENAPVRCGRCNLDLPNLYTYVLHLYMAKRHVPFKFKALPRKAASIPEHSTSSTEEDTTASPPEDTPPVATTPEPSTPAADPLNCFCGRTYLSPQDLSEHRIARGHYPSHKCQATCSHPVPGTDDTKLQICTYCNRWFGSLLIFQDHLLATGHVSCEECWFAFRSLRDLNAHFEAKGIHGKVKDESTKNLVHDQIPQRAYTLLSDSTTNLIEEIQSSDSEGSAVSGSGWSGVTSTETRRSSATAVERSVGTPSLSSKSTSSLYQA